MAAHFQQLSEYYKELNLIKTSVIGSTYEKRKIIMYTLGRGKSGRGLLVLAEERPADQGLRYCLFFTVAFAVCPELQRGF